EHRTRSQALRLRPRTRGVVFLNNRHYQPSFGVFLSVDPITVVGDPATLNPYTYAHARPIAMSDATGLRPDFDTGDEARDWFRLMQTWHAERSSEGPLNGGWTS